MCGAGTAGGNRCVPDTLSPNPYSLNQSAKKINSRENFDSDTSSNCNGCNTTEFVIFVLIVLALVGMIYSKNTNNLD